MSNKWEQVPGPRHLERGLRAAAKARSLAADPLPFTYSVSRVREVLERGDACLGIVFMGAVPDEVGVLELEVSGRRVQVRTAALSCFALPPAAHSVVLARSGATKQCRVDLVGSRFLVIQFHFVRRSITMSYWDDYALVDLASLEGFQAPFPSHDDAVPAPVTVGLSADESPSAARAWWRAMSPSRIVMASSGLVGMAAAGLAKSTSWVPLIALAGVAAIGVLATYKKPGQRRP